jgi:tetratricopeptide (TPR) repeat protein|tara:strand:- start:529 stop:1752 length:1224 start_codon:yes stop_codon:yes gene_type:complete
MKKMKIKNGILTLVLLAITTLTFAQSHNVTSAAIIFKQYNSERDTLVKALKIKEAKEFIDQAYNNESTSNEPKMWMVRAKIYKIISFNYSDLDGGAIFKATESHLKCMQPHPKKKNKIIIYKKWDENEVFEGLIQCANKLFNLAVESYQEGNFQESLNLYEPIYKVIELDDEGKLKSIKITTESVLYNSYLAAKAMKNNELSKSFLQKLMDINSIRPSIYSSMSNIYLEEGNNERALECLTLGREIFNTDQGLINSEIDLYLKLGKSDELIKKLSNAIELDSINDIFYVIRGTCYQNRGDITKAIFDYNKALEINFEQATALNNISSCYLLQAEPIIKKMNNLSLSQTSKFNKLKLDLRSLYLKTLPFLKKYLELNPNDKQILNVLIEVYTKLDMYKEAKEVKLKFK